MRAVVSDFIRVIVVRHNRRNLNTERVANRQTTNQLTFIIPKIR